MKFKHEAARYGLAVLVALVAAFLRWALEPLVGTSAAFITVFPAMMLVAVTLGPGPGLACTALGIALVEWFFIGPSGIGLGLEEASRAVILLSTSAYVGWVSTRLRAAREQADIQAAAARAAETDLRTSEERVRRKLESVLAPEGALGMLDLADIVDTAALQRLMDDFYPLSRIPMAIIDLKGRVLVGVGWQDICNRFHRVHPDTCRHCLESDLELSAGLAAGEHRLYKCKNNLWDMATPIFVAGQHMGNIFTGQFFFEDETADRELFRSQALTYGFDEESYLAALDRVPHLSRETVEHGMSFFLKLADMISQLGYSNVKLARLLAERDRLNEQLEQRVRERTSQLVAANRELEAFCYSISHDLRTPLRTIDGFSQAALEDCGAHLDAVGRDYLNRVRGGCRHMDQLIDDLLNLSRVTRDQMRLEKVDLTALAHAVVDQLRESSPPRDIEFRIAPGLSAFGDARLLRAALSNLLENAWKFTGHRPDAVIEVGTEGGEGLTSVSAPVSDLRSPTSALRPPSPPVFFVRDNGVGFDMRYSDKLFNAFQRLHTVQEFPGTGIGLATVARVIQRHGGRIWAEAAVGRGATFYFTLEPEPAAPPQG